MGNIKSGVLCEKATFFYEFYSGNLEWLYLQNVGVETMDISEMVYYHSVILYDDVLV